MLVDDWQGIVGAVNDLEQIPAKGRATMINAGRKWVDNFTWQRTASVTYDALKRAYDKKPR